MTKRKASDTKQRRPEREIARAAAETRRDQEGWLSAAATRETIESVIIAFVLAFLFRTFEAEAFVIPTGSMAPTLMGKHKDLECPLCHYRYRVNASDATDPQHEKSEPVTVLSAVCPMCRFKADLAAGNPQGVNYETYDGDRILVAKFPYDFADPKRWDVVVFKFPGNSTMNYIKRLVGLPGETIRIHDGNLWIHEPGQPEGQFEIARKPPAKVLAMLQPVFDNDLAPKITGVLKWPPRWAPEGPDGASWTNGKDLSSFEIKDSVKREAWIRYRNRVPTRGQWNEVAAAAGAPTDADAARLTPQQRLDALKQETPSERVPPQLITDFAAYNTAITTEARGRGENGMHWVGDLAVEFELESKAPAGTVAAELVKGGRHFQCRFDLASGKAQLSISGGGTAAGRFHPSAATAVAGAGRHAIIFSNVDDELLLWVDGSVVKFDSPTTYESAELHNRIPTADDLSPAGIGAESAAVQVSHIRILRDVYYIAVFNRGASNRSVELNDFIGNEPNLFDPANWPNDFSNGPNGNMKSVEIPLKPRDPADPAKDQFFVLGDNSPQSADGRLWAHEWWVDRELFLGKALFIYWPHGWKIPYLPLPFNPIPHVSRMHLVR